MHRNHEQSDASPFTAVLDRRSLLRAASMSALALGAGGVLAACGTPGAKVSADKCVSTDLSSTQKQLTFSNWPRYIDDDHGNVIPSLARFTNETGIAVAYNTDVNDNVEFYTKVRDQLASCQPTGRDVFVVSDWMVARMMGLGWLQKLDPVALPNVQSNLIEPLKTSMWKKVNNYAVPWQAGATIIAYNRKAIGELRSVAEMLSRPELKGKVSLLAEMRDTMGFILRMTGSDPANFTEEQWARAVEKMKAITASGQVRRFTGADYAQDLVAGNVNAALAWSSDIANLQVDNPDIDFVIPEEGAGVWTDMAVVPNRADHLGNAERMLDFYYQPDVAAAVTASVQTVCPVRGAREVLRASDPALADNPLIFPSDNYFAKPITFMDLDEATETRYQTDFRNATGA